MKNHFSILLLSVIAMAASCSKEAEGTQYRPNGDDGKELHFSVSSLSKSFPDGERSGVIELSIVRPGTKGDHIVYLTQKGADEQFFTIPSSATIKDGEYVTVVPVIVDLTECVKGALYGTNIYISERDQATGNYGVKNDKYADNISLSVEIEIEWMPLMRLDEATGEMVQQTATFNYAGFWKGRSTGLPVEIGLTDGEQTIYRVSDWGTNNKYFSWVVNADRTCVVPKQNTGYHISNYDQDLMVSDYPTNGTNSTYTYKNYPCTWDGENTFTFNLIYYREGSTGNYGKGVETLVFDNSKERKGAVSIEYRGVDSTSTGFLGASLSFKPNEFTARYDVKIYADTTVTGGTTLYEETFYERNTQSWNIPTGPHAVTAVAYDEEGNVGDTTIFKFTFDPDSVFCVKINEFSFIQDDENPTSCARGKLKTTNLAKGYSVCMSASGWKNVLKTQSGEEYLRTKTPMTKDQVNAANSSKGRSFTYTSLNSSTEYVLAVLLENRYGESVYAERIVKTGAKSEDSQIEDFDKSATLDSFIGSYLLTCGVGATQRATTETTFRVDIVKMDDNRVVISGLASPIKDWDAEVVAYFDSQRHCLVLDPQPAGMYEDVYAHFAIYTSSSSYAYKTGAYLLGIVDDKVVWVNSPDYTTVSIGYLFMKFSAYPASSDTYMKQIVDSKVFVNPSMVPLEKFSE